MMDILFECLPKEIWRQVKEYHVNFGCPEVHKRILNCNNKIKKNCYMFGLANDEYKQSNHEQYGNDNDYNYIIEPLMYNGNNNYLHLKN